MAETKEQLVSVVKEWVRLDNEIRKLQSEIRVRRTEKTTMSGSLIRIMKEHNIDCFDLKEGQLLYTKKNVKKPITKKILLDILGKYYDGDILKANEVKDFIMNNREEVVKESISLAPLKV